MPRRDTSNLSMLSRRQRLLNYAVLTADPSRRRTLVEEYDDYNWGEEDVSNYVEAYNCRPPPLFIPIITIAQVSIFEYYVYKLNTDKYPENDVTATKGVPIASPLIYNPKRRYEVWRYLTYMFIHKGYLHVSFNCSVQLALGMLLELVHKFWRVGIVYSLGVIAGSLTQSLFEPKVFLAGASGGCYALLGAHFAVVIINWKEMQDGWTTSMIKLLSSGVVRIVALILVSGTDTGFAIYFRHSKESSRIGYASHAGGFFTGILIGIPVLRNLDVKPWEKVAFWVCLIMWLLYILIAVLFNLFCSFIDKCYPNQY